MGSSASLNPYLLVKKRSLDQSKLISFVKMKIQMQFWLSMIVLSLSGFNGVIGQCLPGQKALLVQLRNDLTFDSSVSTKLSLWNDGIDCCRWRGVQCDNGGRIIGLDLSNDSISGSIDDSSSLFRLRFLRRLSLATNFFDYSSPLPAGLGKLTELNYLNLSETGFGGQIPNEFSRLSRLVTLDLSNLAAPNVLLLKLENPNLEMLVRNLTKLRELRLDGVDISAQGPHWSQALSASVPDLQVLSLSSCNISDPPDSSLAKLQSLSVIRLDGNSFFSPVPDFFVDFPSLTVLSLSSSDLLEETPQKIFQVSTLKTIDLSNNRELGGSLPEFPHNGSLENLELSYTKFSGNLSESIGSLRMLTSLSLSNCNFTGDVPSLSNLSQLVYLDLSGNHFTGSLPKLSQSKNLTKISLAGNKLTGEIPPEWGSLENLELIDLSNNLVNGSLPPFLFSLPSLELLGLSNNQFSGPISEIEDVPPSPLTSLDLSGNRLEGPFPRFLFNIRGLSSLWFSSNRLSGPVELIKFADLENLTSLDLSYNNLSVRASGTDSDFSLLPKFSSLVLASCKLQEFPFLKNQSSLLMLDLSDNQMSGEIPNWVWELTDGAMRFVNLSHNGFTALQEPYSFGEHQYLDLHSNLLRGEIPKPPKSAVYIDLSNNNFSSPMSADIGNYISSVIFFRISNSSVVGNIPLSLCNASTLVVLDLSDNNLSGSIPSCLIEQSRNLKVLNLGQNKLRGKVPSVFPQDCGLETLDLSYNRLEGEVPKSLMNCSALKVLNLRNNKINDSFPCWSKKLSDLQVLVLHSNRFHGDLSCPEANNSWLNLQTIDIGSNNFQGVLPHKFFSDLIAMRALNEFTLPLDYLHYQKSVFTVYHQDSVIMNYKGNPRKLKILTVTAIDASHNNLQGQIPETVGDLRSVLLLNLSNNAFTAQIPPSLGNLRYLEALDLSVNRLSGEIPQQLASLTFLSFLNVSYNQLEGRIPTGTQISTFAESSFEGNKALCGFPLNQNCGNATTPSPPEQTFEEKQLYSWTDVYVSAAIGFLVGLGLIFWPLWISKRWRKCCNKFFDDTISRIFPKPKEQYVHLNNSW